MFDQDKQYKEKMKNTEEKFLNEAEDRAKKAMIKKIITFLGVKGTLILVLVIILGSLLSTIFLASAVYFNDWDTKTKAVSAKEKAIGNEALGNIITLEDNKYRINYDGKTGKEAIESILEDNDMNFEDFTDEEIECLYKCLKAEWTTTYPNLGETVDNADIDSEYVQGVITVKRANYNNTEGKELTYKPYEEFSGIKDATALDYFSLKDGNIIVASWSTNEIIYTPSDTMPDEIKSQYVNRGEQINIKETTIDYRNMIGMHTVPFEFLLALLVNTEDINFVNELADLALNSTIEITVYDNTTEITTVETEHIKETTTYKKWVDYYITTITEKIADDGSTEQGQPSNTYTNDEEITSTEKKEVDYTLTTKIITRSNSYVIGLTNVSSWFADIKNEYNYYTEYGPEEDLGLGSPNTYKIEYEKENINFIDSDFDIKKFKDSKYSTVTNVDSDNNSKTIITKIYTITGARKQGTLEGINELTKNTSKINEYKYESGTKQTLNIGKKFEETYDKHAKAQAQLDSVSSWLFELLEETESSVDYVSVMKYLLYISTGRDYGITEDSIKEMIDIYQSTEFMPFYESGDSLEWFKKYLHTMEAGKSPKMNAEGTKYIAVDDGLGVPTVGWGVNISANFGLFKEVAQRKGISIDIEKLNYMGAQIDKELVDEVENEIINRRLKEINEKYPEMEPYQKYALLSQLYQKGSLSNGFDSSYKQAWNQDRDLEYGNCTFSYKDSSVDILTSSNKNDYGYFNHDLCQNGFFPNWEWTIREGLGGLRKRRRADWVMFKSGWNMITHTYCPTGYQTVETGMFYNDLILEKTLWLENALNNNGFKYHELYEQFNGNITHPMLNADGSVNKANAKYIDGNYRISCASFVTEVLKQAGIYTGSRTIWAWKDANTLISRFNQNGITVKEVTPQEALPGDLIFHRTNVHVNIITAKTETNFTKTGSPEFYSTTQNNRHYGEASVSRLSDWIILRVVGTKNGVQINNESKGNKSFDNFLFIGDSYTEGIATSLEAEGAMVEAKHSTKPSDWMGKISEIKTTHFAQKNPNAVCILLGVNQVAGNNAAKDMKTLLQNTINEFGNGVPIYVQKVFPVGKGYRYGDLTSTKMNKYIDDYNKEIKNYCETIPNLHFIDTTNGNVGSEGFLKNSSDQLHLNSNGNKLWISEMKKAMLN